MSEDLKPGCPVRGVFEEYELLRTPRDGLRIGWGSSASVLLGCLLACFVY